MMRDFEQSWHLTCGDMTQVWRCRASAVLQDEAE